MFRSYLLTKQVSDVCWCRVDGLLSIQELVLFALLVFTFVALYFKFIGLAFFFACGAALLYVCIRLKRKHKRSKQRMLLPLSM
jgi:Flp pilus assembly protein TadB